MENAITQISLYDQFIADMEMRSLTWNAANTEISGLRKKGFTAFKTLGFPTIKNEEWKYTSLSPFLKEEYAASLDRTDQTDPDASFLEEIKIPSLDCYTIVLFNGKYTPHLSDTISVTGIEISSLEESVDKPSFKANFAKYINIEKNHFAALNTALFSNGLFIEIKSKTIVEKPIHIIHITNSDKNTFIHPRQLFVIGAHAEANIIETYATVSNTKASVFVNDIAEISIGENAKLHHYIIQTGNNKTKHIQQTEIYQQRSSLYNNYKASFPGIALLRNNLNVVLDGTNTESHLYGLYLSGGKQLVDNHTLVDHRYPNCQSNELYKGVMKDEATGVFNGKIFVRQQAQKTNAFQQNNNMILGTKASVNSKPQLEIFADDVKCSHGSTVGQFNEDALFYLRSRGIGDAKARVLLVHAFAFDVTDKFAIPELQEYLNHLIETGLQINNISNEK